MEIEVGGTDVMALMKGVAAMSAIHRLHTRTVSRFPANRRLVSEMRSPVNLDHQSCPEPGS